MAGKRRRLGKYALPGFRLSLGLTLFYLGLIVLLPLSMLFVRASNLGFSQFCHVVFSPRAMASYRLSLGASFVAALTNACFGLVVAWVLERYTFPGKRLVDGLVDLPFALPTAVAGIALCATYSSKGFLGQPLYRLGITSAFSPLGIVIALTFIGVPFVVRTVQPVLHDLSVDAEEAAATLGAGRWEVLRRVVFPELRPALLTGFALAFARGIGEYGSVVFISGNMPMKTEITPLLIMTKLEQFDYPGATAIATVLLVLSFLLLLSVNALQWWSSRIRPVTLPKAP